MEAKEVPTTGGEKKIVINPQVLSSFQKDLAEAKLELAAKEIAASLERVRQVHGFVENLFRQGGPAEGVQFNPCDARDHNFYHVNTVVEMFLKIVTADMEKNPGLHTSLTIEDVEDTILAAILHDTGWLTNSEDGGKYATSPEKYFVHCDQSVRLAPIILQACKDAYPDGLTDERISRIQRRIAATEFNRAANEERPETADRLAYLLRAADNLSYFCDAKDMPGRVMNLFWEGLASVNPEDRRARENYEAAKAELLASLQKRRKDLTAEDLDKLFDGKALTVAQIKFPQFSQHAGLFVGSPYIPFMLESPEFAAAIELLPKEDYRNFLINVAKAKALEHYLGVLIRNPLTFFEAFMTPFDLKLVAQEFNLSIDEPDFGLRLLGAGKFQNVGLFERLATPLIKKLLAGVAQNERRRVFGRLMAQVLDKGVGKERIYCAVAPLAYEELGITLEDIRNAMQDANSHAPQGAALMPIITIRQDQGDADKLTAQVLLDHGFNQVVWGGVEKEPLANFKAQIENLVAGGMNVILIAGQTANKELAQANIKTALEMAKGNPKLKLFGLQHLDDFNEETLAILRELDEDGRLLMTLAADVEGKIVASLDEHPLFKLAAHGIYPDLTVINQQMPTTPAIEAMLAVSRLPLPQELAARVTPAATGDAVPARADFIQRYQEYFQKEMRGFLDIGQKN